MIWSCDKKKSINIHQHLSTTKTPAAGPPVLATLQGGGVVLGPNGQANFTGSGTYGFGLAGPKHNQNCTSLKTAQVCFTCFVVDISFIHMFQEFNMVPFL